MLEPSAVEGEPPDGSRVVQANGSRRRRVLVRSTIVGLVILLAIISGLEIAAATEASAETTRTTARFDPPVWAGQNVPGACSGGFYARHDKTIVITIAAHCASPGDTLRDAAGVMIGTFGPRAQEAACPKSRFCAPSDFLALSLVPGRIPWGHLNMVDLGAGGYRTLSPGMRALTCADIQPGETVEMDGREHFRRGLVVNSFRYEYPTDTIFPCMVAADIQVMVGDSGSAVLVDGLPAGITSRELNGKLGFTPLAEGLSNLGLTLCTTPDCDLSPTDAIQPGS